MPKVTILISSNTSHNGMHIFTLISMTNGVCNVIGQLRRSNEHHAQCRDNI